MDQLLSTHGRLVVVRVLLAQLVQTRSRPEPVLPVGLNDHLRRDIGLPPLPGGRTPQGPCGRTAVWSTLSPVMLAGPGGGR